MDADRLRRGRRLEAGRIDRFHGVEDAEGRPAGHMRIDLALFLAEGIEPRVLLDRHVDEPVGRPDLGRGREGQPDRPAGTGLVDQDRDHGRSAAGDIEGDGVAGFGAGLRVRIEPGERILQ